MAKNRKLFTPKQGDWLIIPARNQWFCGRIMRMGKSGVCVGLFWGPFQRCPELTEVAERLTPENALWCTMFFATYAAEGRWTIVDLPTSWSVLKWKVPSFKHQDGVSHQWYRRTYEEEEFLLMHDELVGEEFKVANLPTDGLANSGAVEGNLAYLAKMRTNEFKNYLEPGMLRPRHYMRFYDMELAEHAAAVIGRHGLATDVRAPREGDSEWLVIATHCKAEKEDAVAEMATRLRGIVESFGGEYDKCEIATT